MEDKLIRDICREVISKKELRNLDVGFVKDIVSNILCREPKIQKKLEASKNFKEFSKSKEFRQTLKDARALLREVYGIFALKGFEKRAALLHAYLKTHKDSILKELLATHKSTKERLPYFKEAYERIFSMVPAPKKIIDLGCGLNPLAYGFIPGKPEYIASDLCGADCQLIQSFFDGMHINGRAFAFDLTKSMKTQYAGYLTADVCFLFKVLDSLETLQKNISEKLIDEIPCKYLVVSFPTQSIGGRKKIGLSRRTWFMRMIRRKGWQFECFEIPGEIFYILEKKNKKS